MKAQLHLDFANDAAVAVMGRGERFVLVALYKNGFDEAALDKADESGFEYCGVIAYANGRAYMDSKPDADAFAVMCLAYGEYTKQIASVLGREPVGDSVDWLCDLWKLPDPRN